MLPCHDITALLDDYLDDRLDAGRQRAVLEHLPRCTGCRRCYEEAAALQAVLRALPAPAPAPDFVEQALARASRAAAPARPYSRRALFGFALAATLVLGLALGVLVATQPAQGPLHTVVLTLEQPETVRLVFDSARPLQAATLRLQLPENVELAGYRGRRELTWQTDLRAGENLLQLPLVAHGPAKGALVARLSHGESSKTFQLNIEVKPQGGMS